MGYLHIEWSAVFKQWVFNLNVFKLPPLVYVLSPKGSWVKARWRVGATAEEGNEMLLSIVLIKEHMKCN